MATACSTSTPRTASAGSSVTTPRPRNTGRRHTVTGPRTPGDRVQHGNGPRITGLPRAANRAGIPATEAPRGGQRPGPAHRCRSCPASRSPAGSPKPAGGQHVRPVPGGWSHHRHPRRLPAPWPPSPRAQSEPARCCASPAFSAASVPNCQSVKGLWTPALVIRIRSTSAAAPRSGVHEMVEMVA